MRIPTEEEALLLLDWADELNHGAWKRHSINVGKAAREIAQKCGLNPRMAYVMGLLHDIGRFEGITHIHHILAGYNLMIEKGYDCVAKICLTHSFPIKNINMFSGKNDCSPDEVDFIQSFLINTVYDDYDKLIQLCDALGDSNGITLVELRLMDVTKRYGFNDLTLQKWEAYDELKDYFSTKCGIPIYKLFGKDICKNILEFSK